MITFGEELMPIAYFPSLANAEVVEVAFAATTGGDLNLRLLVDFGFTGSSWFVLSRHLVNIAMSPAPAVHAFGAIHGIQQRVTVFCRIPAISYQARGVAIVTDLGPMGLPSGVDGTVSLRFLRQFRRWGSEKLDDGSWQFFLET